MVDATFLIVDDSDPLNESDKELHQELREAKKGL